MVNELSKALSVAEMKVQYDVQCRKVLAQKEVLAWILKNTAEEFQELSLEEIEGCIEGMPEIAAVGVNPGETITGKMIIEYTIDVDGKLTDIKIIKAIDSLTTDQIVTLLNKYNYILPGYQRGEPIRVKIRLPLSFNIR